MSGFLDENEIEKFQNLIEDYQMNSVARAEFVASPFSVIAGPTGAGKDTIRNRLIKDNPERYAPILSTTTRSPRVGEQDGIDYHFRSKEKVEESLKIGEYFQAALVHSQQVSCLHIDEIKKLRVGQTGLSILIVQTEQQLRKIKSDIKTIFIVPPTLNELKNRLQKNRSIDETEMSRRLKAAAKELEIALEEEDYFCLINDEIDTAVESANDYFVTGQIASTQDNHARKICKKILDELKSK